TYLHLLFDKDSRPISSPLRVTGIDRMPRRRHDLQTADAYSRQPGCGARRLLELSRCVSRRRLGARSEAMVALATSHTPHVWSSYPRIAQTGYNTTIPLKDAPMPHDLILGTAGHIDHGKTSLVKALTGID